MDENSCCALHQLAKRKHPDYPFYNATQWIHNDNYGNKRFVCLICGDELVDITTDPNFPKDDAWAKHGYEHLKELNLLPFV